MWTGLYAYHPAIKWLPQHEPSIPIMPCVWEGNLCRQACKPTTHPSTGCPCVNPPSLSPHVYERVICVDEPVNQPPNHQLAAPVGTTSQTIELIMATQQLNPIFLLPHGLGH